MTNRSAPSEGGVFRLPTCDVCGRVLPKGTATRHSTCEITSEKEATFNTILLMERSRFEGTIQGLNVLRRYLSMRQYDNAVSAHVVLDMCAQMSKTYGPAHATVRDIAHLKYQFLRFAPDHPMFRQG